VKSLREQKTRSIFAAASEEKLITSCSDQKMDTICVEKSYEDYEKDLWN
jgi:hypothetical protein